MSFEPPEHEHIDLDNVFGTRRATGWDFWKASAYMGRAAAALQHFALAGSTISLRLFSIYLNNRERGLVVSLKAREVDEVLSVDKARNAIHDCLEEIIGTVRVLAQDPRNLNTVHSVRMKDWKVVEKAPTAEWPSDPIAADVATSLGDYSLGVGAEVIIKKHEGGPQLEARITFCVFIHDVYKYHDYDDPNDAPGKNKTYTRGLLELEEYGMARRFKTIGDTRHLLGDPWSVRNVLI